MSVSDPKFQLFYAKDNRYYYRLRAKNGDIILESDGYSAKQSAEDGIRNVKASATCQRAFKHLTTRYGRPYFVLKAHQKVVGISETYRNEESRDLGIATVMANAPAASIEDLA